MNWHRWVHLDTVLNRDGYRVRPRPRPHPRIPRKPSADEDENEDEEDGPSTVSRGTRIADTDAGFIDAARQRR